MGAKHFGARVTRLEDPALLSGRGRFVDDVKLPGRAARLLRPLAARACPVARHRHQAGPDHARRPRGHDATICRIRCAANRCRCCCQSGDRGAVHPARAGARRSLLCRPAGRGRDRRRPLHRRGCRRGGAVDYDVLPAVGDCRAAIEDGAARAHALSTPTSLSTFQLGLRRRRGAPSPTPPHIFEEEFWQHRGGGMALETRAVLASYDPATDC